MVSDLKIIKAANENLTMASAAAQLRLHFNTFSRRAKKLNVYRPNQGGIGQKQTRVRRDAFKTQDILNGKHPQYQTLKLKKRLLKEGIKENICEECDLDGVWNGLPLNMELEHIDGDRTNHRLENLKMLCPNCHSLTDTYRGKNKA